MFRSSLHVSLAARWLAVHWLAACRVAGVAAGVALLLAASCWAGSIPDPLGTSRTIAVDPAGGPCFGLRQYPDGRLPLEPREVVLTFDDGPWPVTTAKVLDALAAEGVKATFFILGQNAEARPELVRRMQAEGHTVALHSYSHPRLDRMPFNAAKADIVKGFAAVDLILHGKAGAAPRTPFFRFPYLSDTPELREWLSRNNIAVFSADLWGSDWVKRPADEQRSLILSRLEKTAGGLLLLHDTKGQTAEMLPALLRDLKRQGYHVAHLIPKE